MKKLLCLLLTLLFTLPALAEDVSPFAPYSLTAPEGVTLEEGEASHTFVQGHTRVVAMAVARVPDENPSEAIIRLMGQFAPDAVIGEDLPLAEGYWGLTALSVGKFGAESDQVTVMILSTEGDLLILAGYSLDGAGEQVQALLDALLASLTVEGAPVLLPQAE